MGRYTVVSRFCVLRFSALSRFSALNAGDGAWSHHKYAISIQGTSFQELFISKWKFLTFSQYEVLELFYMPYQKEGSDCKIFSEKPRAQHCKNHCGKRNLVNIWIQALLNPKASSLNLQKERLQQAGNMEAFTFTLIGMILFRALSRFRALFDGDGPSAQNRDTTVLKSNDLQMVFFTFNHNPSNLKQLLIKN